MILGTIVLLVGVVYHLGGVESAVNKLTEIDPSLVSPLRSEMRCLIFNLWPHFGF